MQLVPVLTAVAVIAVASYCLRLGNSYIQARKAGLPIIVTFVHPHAIWWIILRIPFTKFLKKILPHDLYLRFELTNYGFEMKTRTEPYEKLGQSYMLVGPGAKELWIGDPGMARAAAANKDIQQSNMAHRFIELFGPNILSAHGEAWSRQRKIIAPILNESISESVWIEGAKQATDMLDSLTESSANGAPKEQVTQNSTESVEGLRRIAINVLGAVGYGRPRSWNAKDEAPSGHKLSYMESVFAIVSHLALAVFIPPSVLCLPIFKPEVRKVGVAKTEYPEHTKEMIAHERSTADITKNNLMSVIVRLSDQEKNAMSKSKLYLSEDEISGNLFIFTLAAFDTTSNTMAYAFTQLALHPELQDWIIEEIDQVLPNTKEMPTYEEAFPRLKRVLALMFETLRLYTPVPHLARETKVPLILPSSTGARHSIPANTNIYISPALTHVCPLYWGADSTTFRPARWMVTSPDGSTSFFEPPKGTFAPWSFAPRTCPGQKMSQVEFVTVFANLFRRARVEPVLCRGETLEDARRRLRGVVEDSQPLITLQMNRPRDFVVRWKRRE